MSREHASLYFWFISARAKHSMSLAQRVSVKECLL